jgi:flagellar secretion chaperone FliS
MTVTTLRSRYLQDSVSTASPAQLLIMLYDRLVLDLNHAESALRDSDRTTATARLMHAQEIVMELRTTLDTSAWAGASGLASLYGFLLTELVGANVRGDADRVASCRALVEPLRDAWREASQAAVADARAAAAA